MSSSNDAGKNDGSTNIQTPFLVSSSPHIRAEESTGDIMRWVCIALAPAFGVALFNFGPRALLIALIAVISCVITEFICLKWRGRPVTVGDFSAVLSGLLLAAVLPPNVAWWLPVIGGIFAMGIVKHAFGGLGSNIWNPALAARALLQVAFPTQINAPEWPRLSSGGQTLWERCQLWIGESFKFYSEQTTVFRSSFVSPMPNNAAVNLQAAVVPADVVSAATPLTALKNAATDVGADAPQTLQQILGSDYWTLVKESFSGLEGGCIAETSAAALLIGGLFLLFKKIITWETPFFYLLTVALLCWILPAPYLAAGETAYTPWFSGPVLLQLCGGGLLLGAFFMDTDYVTTPLTRNGKIIFAVGCGIITALIRLYSGSYPEGCCYSILIMNTCVPLIDSWTKPKKYGAA